MQLVHFRDVSFWILLFIIQFNCLHGWIALPESAYETGDGWQFEGPGSIITLDSEKFGFIWQNDWTTYLSVYDRFDNLSNNITIYVAGDSLSSSVPLTMLDESTFIGIFVDSDKSNIKGVICNYTHVLNSTVVVSGSGGLSFSLSRLGNVTTSPCRFLVAWINVNTQAVQFQIFNLNLTSVTSVVTLQENLGFNYGIISTTTVFTGTSWNWVVAYDAPDGPHFFVINQDGFYNPRQSLCCGSGVHVSGGFADSLIWAAVWTDANSDIQAQFFYENGTAYSNTAFRVNEYTNGIQNAPWISEMAGGKFAVGWVDDTQNGDGTTGVFGNVLHYSGTLRYAKDVRFSDNESASEISISSFPGNNEEFVVMWKGENSDVVFRVMTLPSPSVSPTPSISSTPTPSYSVSTSPSISPVPSSSLTPMPSNSRSPSASRTPSRSVTPSSTCSPSMSSTPSPSITPSRSVTPSATCSPSITPSPSISSIPSPTSIPSMSTSAIASVSSQATPSPADRSADGHQNLAPMIGGIAAGGALVAISVIGLVVWRKRNKKRDTDLPNVPADDPEQGQDIELQNMTQHNKIQDENNTKSLAYLENDKGWKIDIATIQVQKELGRGAFGVVHKCTWRNIDCVIKLLNVSHDNQAAINALIREARTVRNLRNHGNVCAIYGVCTDPVGIVMEYVGGGSMLDCLANDKILLNTKKILKFAKDIAGGMSHLHAENIIHLDLACRNLLVSFAANDVQHVKITDFGLSRLVENETYQASAGSSFPVRWTAPETLSLGLITRASDVWSFAVTLWEMIERQIPYSEFELANNQIAKFLASGKRLSRPTAVEIPDELWHLMFRCWTKAPAARPTFDEICIELKNIEQKYFGTELDDNNHQYEYEVILMDSSNTDYKLSPAQSENNSSQSETQYGSRGVYTPEQTTNVT